MDSGLIVIIALFACIVVGGFLIYRSKGRVAIKGPFGTALTLDGSNKPNPRTPGLIIEDAKSRTGGLIATDETGQGLYASKINVETDIEISTKSPK